jgi:hypothetical protein
MDKEKEQVYKVTLTKQVQLFDVIQVTESEIQARINSELAIAYPGTQLYTCEYKKNAPTELRIDMDAECIHLLDVLRMVFGRERGTELYLTNTSSNKTTVSIYGVETANMCAFNALIFVLSVLIESPPGSPHAIMDERDLEQFKTLGDMKFILSRVSKHHRMLYFRTQVDALFTQISNAIKTQYALYPHDADDIATLINDMSAQLPSHSKRPRSE